VAKFPLLDHEYPTITLFLLGGLFRLLCRGLFRRHGFSPPFIRMKSIKIERHETGPTGSMVAFGKIRRGHECPRQSHSRDFKKSYFFLVAFFLVAFFFAFFLAAIICPPPFGIPRF
jgi:hypothetical protein